MLVVCTEQAQILFIAPSGNEVKLTVKLEAVPVSIICEGQFDVEYKCFVACRNGAIYTVSKGQVESMI